MKFHYQTSIYALVALVSQACFTGAAKTATTRNVVERDLSSNQQHGHKLTIDFDEITSGSVTGWYVNEHIQMENFQYYRNAPSYVVKSSPNCGFDHVHWGHAIMSCPGGSFDLISMCITNWRTTPELVAVFNGTLTHDDSCGITIDKQQGTSEPLKAEKMKCLNFNRGYKDLSSVHISQILKNGDAPDLHSTIMYDNIKIKINRPCDVDNQQALKRMSKNVEVDWPLVDEVGNEGEIVGSF